MLDLFRNTDYEAVSPPETSVNSTELHVITFHETIRYSHLCEYFKFI
jgi:hypothetical protein